MASSSLDVYMKSGYGGLTSVLQSVMTCCMTRLASTLRVSGSAAPGVNCLCVLLHEDDDFSWRRRKDRKRKSLSAGFLVPV